MIKHLSKVVQWTLLIFWGENFGQGNELQIASSSYIDHNLLINCGRRIRIVLLRVHLTLRVKLLKHSTVHIFDIRVCVSVCTQLPSNNLLIELEIIKRLNFSDSFDLLLVIIANFLQKLCGTFHIQAILMIIMMDSSDR